MLTRRASYGNARCPLIRLGFNENNVMILSEPQPPDFQVRINYKQGGHRIVDVDTMVAVTGAMSRLARRGFQRTLTEWGYSILTVAVYFRGFKKDNISKYTTKTVMWTLREILCWLETESHYGEANVVSVFLDPNTGGTDEIGFGQVKLSLEDTPSTNESAINETSISTNLAPLSKRNGDEITVTNLSVWDQQEPLEPYVMYICLISLLMFLAEQDPEDWKPSYNAYHNLADMHFGMQATSIPRQPEFKVKHVILAIEEIAGKIAVCPTEQRFKPFGFKIRLNGAFLGKGFFHRGKLFEPSPGEDWNMTGPTGHVEEISV